MANKIKNRIIAILNSAWHYEAHNGDNVLKKGHKFVVKGDNYIAKNGDLVLDHWIQYGDSSVVPAAKINLFIEEVEVVEQVVRKPAKVEGRYIVPVE
jgi:phage terminase large subunit-like protein